MEEIQSMMHIPFDVARQVKWQEGQKKYGPVFVGHPLEQLDLEMIDSLNYIDEAERWGYQVSVLRAKITEIAHAVRDLYATQPGRATCG